MVDVKDISDECQVYIFTKEGMANPCHSRVVKLIQTKTQFTSLSAPSLLAVNGKIKRGLLKPELLDLF